MKKNLLSVLALLIVITSGSQVINYADKALALQLVTENKAAIGINDNDLGNLEISSTYTEPATGITRVYLQQMYKNIPVLNKMLVLAFRNKKLISNTGKMLADPEKLKLTSGTPSLSAENAVNRAFIEQKLPVPQIAANKRSADGQKVDFGKPLGVTEDVTAELFWFQVETGNQMSLKLGWQVQVAPEKTDDVWHIRIDAETGGLIEKVNIVIFENFQSNRNTRNFTNSRFNPSAGKVINDNYNNRITATQTTPRTNLVGSANYLVIPYPYEAPSFTPAAIHSNPWSSAPGNATSLGWHNDGTTDFNITRGNNVWATEDTIGSNTNTGMTATSTTSPDPLNFNFTPNYSVEPSMDPTMQKFCITNLFYWNNITHDIAYQYGFDEIAGNYQQSNQGRGGLGNDYVMALAQSGAAGHIGNNANFLPTSDGVKGRMRMYLFDTITTLRVNSPGSLGGEYFAIEGIFSTNNRLVNVGPVTGQVIYFNDDAGGTTHEACGIAANTLTGKIVMIDRGNCNFTQKVLTAQNAGAIAVIMVNNVSGYLTMSGSDNSITIPAVLISQSDGALFAAQLGNNLNVTLSSTNALDGDLDNGIIVHEYAHGISNRLTGGPNTASCLQNAERGGEGWSDYFGLMQTTNWATANITDGTIPRGVGSYVVGEPTNGAGIRLYPYTTNISINPLTYADMGTGAVGSEVHNIGEIWCAALWEMTWGIIQQENNINTNFYNFSLANNGGNSIAFKLVMEGMKLQPCSPGFIDARNAILTADINLYGGRHQCTIWTAFAKRGMGYSALQGSSGSTTDQTAAFDLPPAPTITSQPVDMTVNPGEDATFTVTSAAPVNGAYKLYKWQVSTNGGSSWNDIVPAVTTNSLTLTAVTVSMNGYKYRNIITQGCNTTTSSVATLTVFVPSGFTFNSPPPTTASCPAPATMDIVLGTTAIGSFSNPITVSSGTAPAGTTVSFIPSDVVTPGNNVTVRLTGTNTLAIGSYTLMITGMATGATNQFRDIIYTINPGTGPVISSQPADQIVCPGTNANFSIVSAGASSFQWQVSTNGGANWNNISGATTASYSATGVTTGMNNSLYRCIATAQCGSTSSTTALLTVNNVPVVSSQPVNASICIGGNTSFGIAAGGTGISYQWQVDSGTGFANLSNGGVNAGVSSDTLTISGATIGMDGNQYRCVVTGTCSPAANSQTATLTVYAPVVITTSPANTEVCSGTDATFTVAGNSVPSILYQWQVSTDGGSAWANISEAKAATYTANNVSAASNNNQYRCLLSGAACSVPATSAAAILTVRQLPTVGLSASPLTTLLPGQATTLTATPTSSTGGTLSINWTQNTLPVSVTGNTLPVTVTNLGTYQVGILETWPSSLACSSLSQVQVIDASVSSKLFIFPSPNDGNFTVSFYNSTGSATKRKIAIYDLKGAMVFNKEFPIAGPYTLIPVNLEGASRGIYYVVVGDVNGKKLAEGKVHVR